MVLVLEKPGNSRSTPDAVPGGMGLPRLCSSGRGQSHSCFVTLGALPKGLIQHILCDRNAGGFWKELCVGRNALQWDVNIKVVVFCAHYHFSVLLKESDRGGSGIFFPSSLSLPQRSVLTSGCLLLLFIVRSGWQGWWGMFLLSPFAG